MAKSRDLTGQKFGRWTVLEKSITTKNGNVSWLCECQCGNSGVVTSSQLTQRKSNSCGCLKNEANVARSLDLRSKKFGSLAVIEFVGKTQKRGRGNRWRCQCDCGNTIITTSDILQAQKILSCGCRIHMMPNKDPKLCTAKTVYSNKYNDGDLDFSLFVQLSQLPCFYCKRPPSNSQNVFNRRSARRSVKSQSVFAGEIGNFVYNGLDRVDSSKPHNVDNVVPCCKHCNRAKLAMTAEEFKNWLFEISAHHLYQITPNELNEAVKMWKAQKETDSNCLESVSELALVS